MWPRSKVLRSRWTTVDGRRMHARVAVGGGPGRLPVVLVHGIGVSSRYMTPVAEALAADFDVYAPDLPGFGRSPARAVLGVDALADALAAWMTAQGLERAALLGNSFGCQVLTSFALRHPGRADRLVFVGPTVDPAARSFLRQVGRGIVDLPREPASLYPILLVDYLAAGFFRMWRTFRYLLDDPVEHKLPRVNVPTLVVRGAADPIAPQRWVEEAARLLPCGRAAVVPAGAHAVNYDAPAQLARVVRLFLNRQADEEGAAQEPTASGAERT